MSLIRNAIVFKAELPEDIEALKAHLAEKQFTDPMPSQPMSAGFVSLPDWDGEMAAEFHGGLAFAFRIDTKVIPSSAVQAELRKRIEQIEDLTGRKPGRKERRELKEEVTLDLCLKALVRTQVVTCYYHRSKRYLVIPTTSSNVSDRIVTALIHAVGSVKTETINVSNIKHGLTTRLKNWLMEDDEAFGDFVPGGEATLVSPEKRKLTVKNDGLDANKQGLLEVINRGHSVTSMALQHGVCSFKLTENFRLKSINVTDDMDADDEDSTWEHFASYEVLNISKVIDALCEMFAYKEE